MKLGTFMTIAAALAAVFGLLFILIPTPLMAAYGVTLSEAASWVGRYFGSALLAIALMTWAARNAPASKGMSAVLLGDLAASLLGLVVAVLHALSGVANFLVWLNVIIYLFLTLGFGYFQLLKPPAAEA